MSSDLQANLTTTLKGNGLTQATSGTDQLTAATRRANAAGRDFQRHYVPAMKGAGNETENAGKKIAEFSHALHRLGGPVGTFARHVGGGAGMAGGLGALSVAFGLAGVAGHIWGEFMEAAAEKAKLAAERHEKLREAIESSNKALEAQAKAGESQAPGRREVLAAGGREAAGAVDFLVGHGVVGRDEANKGIAAIYRAKIKNSFYRREAVDAAAELAELGVPFAQAAELTARGGDLLGTGKGRRALKAHIYQQFTKQTGDPIAIYQGALKNVTGDSYLGQVERNNSIRSQIAGVERTSTIENGDANARNDLRAARDPLGAAMIELNKKAEQQIEALHKNTESHSKFIKWLSGNWGINSDVQKERRFLKSLSDE